MQESFRDDKVVKEMRLKPNQPLNALLHHIATLPPHYRQPQSLLIPNLQRVWSNRDPLKLPAIINWYTFCGTRLSVWVVLGVPIPYEPATVPSTVFRCVYGHRNKKRCRNVHIRM